MKFGMSSVIAYFPTLIAFNHDHSNTQQEATKSKNTKNERRL